MEANCGSLAALGMTKREKVDFKDEGKRWETAAKTLGTLIASPRLPYIAYSS